LLLYLNVTLKVHPPVSACPAKQSETFLTSFGTASHEETPRLEVRGDSLPQGLPEACKCRRTPHFVRGDKKGDT